METHPVPSKLLQVIIEQQSSVMGFAKRINIDMNRYQQFISILRGEKPITKDIAERTIKLFPQYSIDWLLDDDKAENQQNI